MIDSARIIGIFFCLALMAFTGCAASRPSSTELESQRLQQEIDNLNRQREQRLAQQKKTEDAQYELMKQMLDRLASDCIWLRSMRASISAEEQAYNQSEVVFLSTLNENQLKLHSEWYDTLGWQNASKTMLTLKRFNESLKQPQRDQFNALLGAAYSVAKMKSDFNRKSTDFEAMKSLFESTWVQQFGNDAYLPIIREALKY